MVIYRIVFWQSCPLGVVEALFHGPLISTVAAREIQCRPASALSLKALIGFLSGISHGHYLSLDSIFKFHYDKMKSGFLKNTFY